MKDKIRRIPLKERLRRAGSSHPSSTGRCVLQRIMDAPVTAYLGENFPQQETGRLYRLLPEPPGKGEYLSYRDVAVQVCRLWNTPGKRQRAVQVLSILAAPAAEYAPGPGMALYQGHAPGTGGKI